MKVGILWLQLWWRSRIVDPLMVILRRGTEPKQLALSAALGITLGLFPICGVTVFLCAFAVALLGSSCHAPTTMLANFVVTPLELSLMVPFLRFGEWLINSEDHFEISSDAFKKMVTGYATQALLFGIFHVVLGWIVAAPVIFFAIYWSLLPVFHWSTKKLAANQHHQFQSQKFGVALSVCHPEKQLWHEPVDSEAGSYNT